MSYTFTRWIFFRDDDERWQWKQEVSDHVVQSHASFECPDDCLFDAIRAGYQPAVHRATCSRGFKEGIKGPILPGPEMCRCDEPYIEWV